MPSGNRPKLVHDAMISCRSVIFYGLLICLLCPLTSVTQATPGDNSSTTQDNQSDNRSNNQVELLLSELLLPQINRTTLLEAIALEKKQKGLEELEALLLSAETPAQRETLLASMGLLAARAGNPALAEQFLLKANPENSKLAPYLRYWLAQSLMQQNKGQEALDWLEFPIETGSLIEEQIAWLRIEILLGLAKHYEVSRLLAEREQKTSHNLEKIKIKFFEGKQALLRGFKASADKTWRELVINHPANSFEPEILAALGLKALGHGTSFPDQFLLPSEWARRANNLIKQGHPLLAYEIYQRLTKEGLPHALDAAEALFQAKDYERAAEAFRGLWKSPPLSADQQKILSRLISSCARSDQFVEALELTELMIKGYPESADAQLGPYRLAFLYFDSGDYKRARRAYSKLLSGKKPAQGLRARWYRAWSSYLLGDWRDASEDFQIIEKFSTEPELKLGATYWQARSLEKIQQGDRSEPLYSKLIKEAIPGYYSLISEQRKREQKLTPPFLINIAQSARLPEKYEAPTELLDQLTITAGDSLERALLLAQMGQLDFAYDETLRSSLLRNADDPHTLQIISLAQNFYEPMQRIRRDLKIATPRRASHDWGHLFPIAYAPWVKPLAKEYQLPTSLIWGIMRQESAFRPHVHSQAKAIGLMQIIPRTGTEIASSLKETDFHPSDLQDPYTNIRYGTWYLQRQQQRFQGRLPMVIASYNAGPEAVTRWLRWGKHLDDDEFMDLIPFSETRKYVKKVLSNLWFYEALYRE